MSIPYIGYSNDQLKRMPLAKKGMLIECHQCGKDHPLECGKSEDGKETNTIMFFKCNKKIYLGAVAGKLMHYVKPFCSGKIEKY